MKKRIKYDENLALFDWGTGRTREEITRLEILRAMNSVSTDLEFTMELCSDFVDDRLPTLSFNLWQELDGLKHSYFEKSMKNQTLLVERSAMGRHSLMGIMSNELVRRLEVLHDSVPQSEIDGVVNKYTQQLVNSEFCRKQCREIVVSAITGYVRKENRRKIENKRKYRSGEESLMTRENKKLLEKNNWFKIRKTKVVEPKNDAIKPKNKWNHYRKKKEPIKSLEKESQKLDEPPKAVLFVQSTPNSELATLIREVVQKLRPWTGINLKVVERAGNKVQDLIHKSNPWDSNDCERTDCFACNSAALDEKIVHRDCHKRSVVYETWCISCINKEKEERKQTNRNEIIARNNEKKRNRENESTILGTLVNRQDLCMNEDLNT